MKSNGLHGSRKNDWSRLTRRSTSGDADELVQSGSNSRTTIGSFGSAPPTPHKTHNNGTRSDEDYDEDDQWADVPTVYYNKDTVHDPLDERVYDIFDSYNAKTKTSSSQQAKYSLHQRTKEGKNGQSSKAVQEDDEDDLGADDIDRGYSRLQASDLYQEDHVDQGTQYLFDDSKAMTPLSQMQATKDLLTDNQRIAYVSLCRLTIKFYVQSLKRARFKELKPAVDSAELWSMKIMARIYQHMDISKDEQRMIELLSEHGITTADLVPSLMGTSVVPNPEYDPNAEPSDSPRPQAVPQSSAGKEVHGEEARNESKAASTHSNDPAAESVNLDGTVSTTLATNEVSLTIDVRWTILCDLFLTLIADSVYDARSRVFLEKMAEQLGLTWVDVAKFERRVTEALEIEEGVETLRQKEVIVSRDKAGRNRRFVMMGLATLGGGLIIGLSAGLLAPVIGAGLGAAFGTIGITGTTSFLAGTGGAALITTGAAVTGGGIGATGMRRRTKAVQTFEFIPLYNARRVNLIITINGWMVGDNDDVRLPWSVIDPIMGDVFSIFWEPEMSKEMGGALKILTSEVTTQLAQQILQATLLPVLMSSLQLPIMLTKLGYLVDNPWSNALDRAKAAGLLLADVLVKRSLGVRPIVLIGYSLGARAIFYALVELARVKSFGIVQDVFLFGSCVTASQSGWRSAASVVSGRFVNGFARNDWLLGYLFRATTGGLSTVAGLGPVEHVPGLDNVELSHIVNGHFSYRHNIPRLLKEVGFKVTSESFEDFLDEKAEKDRDNKMAKKLRKEMKALEKAAKKQRKQLEKEGKIAPDGTVPDFENVTTAADASGLNTRVAEPAPDDADSALKDSPNLSLSIEPTTLPEESDVEEGEDDDEEELPTPPSPVDEAARTDGVHYDLDKIKETLRDSAGLASDVPDENPVRPAVMGTFRLASTVSIVNSSVNASNPKEDVNRVPTPGSLQKNDLNKDLHKTASPEAPTFTSWAHTRNSSEGAPALSFWSSEGDLYQAPSKDNDHYRGMSGPTPSTTDFGQSTFSWEYDRLSIREDTVDRSRQVDLSPPQSYRRDPARSSKVDFDSNPWG